MGMVKASKVQVSERALIQRLNRKLKENDLIVKKTRPNSKSWSTLGDYYVIDLNLNGIVDRGLDADDLEKMGREKKVLADWETVSA
jgi:hypothetical protein